MIDRVGVDAFCGTERINRSDTGSNGATRDGEPENVSRPSVALPPSLDVTPTLLVEEEALDGYPKLASFLAATKGYAIYKRFASLNARNLLYHQMKLAHLEHELHELDKALISETQLRYDTSCIFGAQEGETAYLLKQMHEQISQALKSYNTLLLEQRQLHQILPADDECVDTIYNFITHPKHTEKGELVHPENIVYAVWDDDRKPIQNGLIALDRRWDLEEHDVFTKSVTAGLMYVFHSRVGT